MLARRRLPIAFLALSVSLWALPASGADPLATCQKAKLKAVSKAAKGTFTCKGSDLKNNAVQLGTFDDVCLSEVDEKFPTAWDKAIAKAAKKGVSCFNAPSSASVGLGVEAAAQSASAAVGAGFAPADDANPDAVKAYNSLMKAAETYLGKTMSAEATHAAKPDPVKLAAARQKALGKLESQFEKQTAKAAKKGIVYSGNPQAVAAAIDTFVVDTASDVTTNPTFPIGTLLDSPVAGVEFSPGLDPAGGNFTLAGGLFPMTDDDPATPGSQMEFRIGGIELTQGAARTVHPRTTLVSLVPGAVDETHPTVTNLARTLQTLDADGNPAKEITITPEVREAAAALSLNFSQSIAGFQADPNTQTVIDALTGQPVLVPTDQAQAHLRSTLIAALAGTYEGTYTGTDFGTWEARISKTGRISVKGQSQDPFDLTRFTGRGALSSDGSANVALGRVSTGATFEGVIAADGTFDGTWENPAEADFGTFTGGRVD